MTQTLTINLFNRETGATRPLTIIADDDSGHIELPDENKTFSEDNLYHSFQALQRWSQQQGWLPLCNGARIDAAMSGLLLDSVGGASIYIEDENHPYAMPPIVQTLGPAAPEKVATLEEQEQYRQDKNRVYQLSDDINAKHDEVQLIQRFAGCLWGLACGDAVGASNEFKRRGSFIPITDMLGGGPHQLKPGEWTDDTSMALCLAASLTRRLMPGEQAFDANDQMQRYLRWRDQGYMSSTGRCFDIGNTVATALYQYLQTGDPYSGPTHERSAGNGSIMRLAPIPMYYYDSIEETVKYAELSSKTTHGAEEAVDACHLFSLMINAALSGKSKQDILFNTVPLRELMPNIMAIQKGEYTEKAGRDIVASGYVVQSLEAALWCFYQTDDFREAVLLAANLGYDSDTAAAICGQLAGAHYASYAIPEDWLYKLTNKTEILALADKLCRVK